MKKLAVIFLIAIAAIKGYSQGNPKTDAELKIMFDVIRNETATGGNTKVRIANAYQALADSKISTKDAVILSGTDTYTGTVNGLTAYSQYDKWPVQFTNANTGASTVNLNSIGAIAIKKNGSSALVSGDINAGQFFWLVYDGTNFQLIGGGSNGGGGGVTSVSGTSNRVTSTGGTTPVLDISGSYVGQSSITTLGTIGTGTWQGTVLAGLYGGTGVANSGKTITLGGDLTTSGAFNTTFTVTGSNTIIFPNASITVARIDAAQTFTGVQTFSSAPVVPTGSPLAGGTNAASQAYADAAVTAASLPAFDATHDGYVANAGVAYKLLYSDGTWLAGGSAGTILKSAGATSKPIFSTATFSDSPGTAGKIMVSDGTNWITSTPTFPNASATTRKKIVSDGTNWVASTETWAVPGTSGNVLTSDGINWTSATPASAPSVASFAEALAGTNDTKIVSPLKNAYVNARVYNVKAYGALGDGKTVTDGAITTGTPNLTSATAAFVAGDVGKYIKVGGAGAAGVDLVTTIAAYVSATAVTLTANASTTVSSQEIIFGTDNTTFIQAAIQAAFDAGGGIVYFPYGRYLICGALQTSVGGQNPNAQLYIPASDATSATRTTITLLGEVKPNSLMSIGATGTLPTTGVILESTILGSGTRPRLIGCVPVTTSFSYTGVKCENLYLRVRSKTANAEISPTETAFGMLYAYSFDAESCVATTTSIPYNSTLPATSTVIGFEMPAQNNSGNVGNILSRCLVANFYKGFELYDHAVVFEGLVNSCVFGFALQYSPQPVKVFKSDGHNCKYNVVWENGAALSLCDFDMFTIENSADNTRWYYNTFDFYAASAATLAYGKVRYQSSVIGTQSGTGNTFGSVYFDYIQQTTRHLALGGLAYPHYGNTGNWDGADNSALLELGTFPNGELSWFVQSATQSGTANTVSIRSTHNYQNASNPRIFSENILTNGATNTGIVNYFIANAGTLAQFLSWTGTLINHKVTTQLRAGTATAGTAPLVFQSGTSLTTAVAGTMEFTTDDLFFTITTGAARKRLLMADATAGLTSGRVPFATTNGRLTDDAGLTYSGGILTLTGKTSFPASGSGAASWNAPHGTAPSSPVNGDFWSTTDSPFMRVNGATVTIVGVSAVNTVTPTAQNRTLTVNLNGTTYYITAKTTND